MDTVMPAPEDYRVAISRLERGVGGQDDVELVKFYVEEMEACLRHLRAQYLGERAALEKLVASMAGSGGR